MADEEEDREFALLYLDGERFEGGRLPVEALEEIQRYQELVLEAAREDWTAKHPGENLPPGFEEDFKLSITGIEAGSAQVLLERPAHQEYASYYEDGRDELDRELELLLAERAEDVPGPTTDDLPLLRHPGFQAFGKSLGKGESIRIGTPKRPARRAARLTPESREEKIEPLVRALEREQQRKNREALTTETRSIAGRLISLNAEARRFEVSTLLYGEVGGSYKDPALTEDLRRVLNSSAKAPVVRFRADVQSRSGRVWRITDVKGVELFEIDGQPWSRKFIDFASLREGWNGEAPGAAEIEFAAMDAARDLLLRFVESDISRPGIFPTEEGGILLEWSSAAAVLNIEIDPNLSFELFHLQDGDAAARQDETESIDVAFEFAREALQ